MTTTRSRSPLTVAAPLLAGLALVLAACGGGTGGMGDCGCDIQPVSTETTITSGSGPITTR